MARIKKDIEEKRYIFLPIGIEGANKETLEALQGMPPLKLKGLKFMEFFQWLSASMGTIVNHTEGEKVDISPDPLDNWMDSFTI